MYSIYPVISVLLYMQFLYLQDMEKDYNSMNVAMSVLGQNQDLLQQNFSIQLVVNR